VGLPAEGVSEGVGADEVGVDAGADTTGEPPAPWCPEPPLSAWTIRITATTTATAAPLAPVAKATARSRRGARRWVPARVDPR
jgi:hypothetical protein